MLKLDTIVLDYNLDFDLLRNNSEYFFTDLYAKYEICTEIFNQVIEKKFDKKFKPIYIISSYLNKNFLKNNNWILIHNELSREEIKSKVLLLDSDETGELITNSLFIKNLISDLKNKQKEVFFYMFSSYNLSLENIKVVGPPVNVVNKYNFKREQNNLFNRLNLNYLPKKIYSDLNLLKKELLIENNFPKFISPNLGQGGYGSNVIYSKKDLKLFCKNHQNNSELYLVSNFLETLLSPNSTGFIENSGKVEILNINDQILTEKINYLGNIFPTKSSFKHKIEIKDMMKKIGIELYKEGYRGLFGCDFIISKDGLCYIVEINPRRQGSYPILCMINNKIIDFELDAKLGKNINFDDVNFETDNIIAHSKLYSKYHSENILIKKIANKRLYNVTAFENASFVKTYYPKNSIFLGGAYGFYINSGVDYNTTLNKLLKDVKNYNETILFRK